MHGSGRGSGAPRGNENTHKHGLYSARMRALSFFGSRLSFEVTGDERREIAALTNANEVRALADLLREPGAEEAPPSGVDKLQLLALDILGVAGLKWQPPKPQLPGR